MELEKAALTRTQKEAVIEIMPENKFEFDFFSAGFVFVFQGCPTMQRLAAVNGLVALVGSESYIFPVSIFIKITKYYIIYNSDARMT